MFATNDGGNGESNGDTIAGPMSDSAMLRGRVPSPATVPVPLQDDPSPPPGSAVSVFLQRHRQMRKALLEENEHFYRAWAERREQLVGTLQKQQRQLQAELDELQEWLLWRSTQVQQLEQAVGVVRSSLRSHAGQIDGNDSSSSSSSSSYQNALDGSIALSSGTDAAGANGGGDNTVGRDAAEGGAGESADVQPPRGKQAPRLRKVSAAVARANMLSMLQTLPAPAPPPATPWRKASKHGRGLGGGAGGRDQGHAAGDAQEAADRVEEGPQQLEGDHSDTEDDAPLVGASSTSAGENLSAKGMNESLEKYIADLKSEEKPQESEPMSPMQRQLYVIVTSTLFERIGVIVIVSNVFLMGLRADLTAREIAKGLVRVLDIIDGTFIAWYVLEVVLKILAHRCSFFYAHHDWKWHIFDLICAIPYDLIFNLAVPDSHSNASGFEAIRILRIMKLFKMLRIIRVLRFFRELRLILYMIVGTMDTFFWTLVMLALFLYVFGILFVQGVEGYLSEGEFDPVYHDDLLYYWGGVGTAIVTSYMALTGGYDWKDVADPLWALGDVYFNLFLFYIALLSLTILNILIGLFCDSAQQVGARDMDTVISEERNRGESCLNQARRLFREIDKGGEGVITTKDYVKARDHHKVRAYFRMLGLDQDNADRVFIALGGVETGSVGREEFVHALSVVKGDAQRQQLNSLAQQMRLYMKQTVCFMEYVEDSLREMYPHALGRAGRLPTVGLEEAMRMAGVPLHKDHPTGNPTQLPDARAAVAVEAE